MRDRYEEALRLVRCRLYNYHEIRLALAEYKAERKAKRQAAAGRSKGRVSDPTALAAMIELERVPFVFLPGKRIVDDPAEWLEVIREVVRALSPDDRKLLEVSFWKRHTWEAAVRELHMNKDTYYRRRDGLVHRFALAAAVKGLVKL